MEPLPEVNARLLFLAATGVMASAAIWFVLAVRWSNGLPAISFQPRRPVPWGIYGAALAVLTASAAIVGALTTQGGPDLENITDTDFVQMLLTGTIQTVVLTVGVSLMVFYFSGANATDLGMPANARQGWRLVTIGVVGWLAVLVPVYGIQAAFVNFFGNESQHPLIQRLLDQANPMLMFMAFVTAVVVAPVCEEVAFRLLFQGYLEKLELSANQADYDVEPPINDEHPVDDGQFAISAAQVDSPEMENIDEFGEENPFVAPTVSEEPMAESPATTEIAEPPPVGLFGLPFGWFSIAITALLFSLAHLGHGPDPFALFVLSIILGYVYQRTHSVVPCIIIHMLFNATSLVALGLLVFS